MTLKYRTLARETQTSTTRLALDMFKEYNDEADKFSAPHIRISACLSAIKFFRGSK